MTRGVEQRIADILESVERCRRYIALLDAGTVDVVRMAEDAIERNLQIIGEAANHLTPDVIDAHPEIAWPEIRGFRNILVHQYFGVDLDVIRDVVENHLPPLADALRQHVEGDPAAEV
ncbi:HepT-like ribonuclease domain-containing protein [Demequina subtropica]|uniref:HepT-like ribonuclease domain-containing protein n=1 Tax=Demequina subtropica TaxID=1638989 RepID=UPI000782A5BF|nr:HepT-like ribonuclease domain-containing protein [Demequina subtropica]